MALIKCPECDGKVSSEANACPHCGYPIENNIIKNTQDNNAKRIKTSYKIKENKVKIIIGIILIFIVIILAMTINKIKQNEELNNLYSSIEKNIKQEKFKEALEIANDERLLGFDNIDEKRKKAKYYYAIELFNKRDFINAKNLFSEIGDYKDTDIYLKYMTEITPYIGTWYKIVGDRVNIIVSINYDEAIFYYINDEAEMTDIKYTLTTKSMSLNKNVMKNVLKMTDSIYLMKTTINGEDALVEEFSQDSFTDDMFINFYYKKSSNDIITPSINDVPYVDMTEIDLLISAWGMPSDVSVTKIDQETSKQYIYKIYKNNYKYVYVENGIVTAIQE